MNNRTLERVRDITSDIESIKSARFEIVNGWGIIKFRSANSFLREPAIRRKCERCPMESEKARELVRRLNEAISPILEAEVQAMENELRELIGGDR